MDDPFYSWRDIQRMRKEEHNSGFSSGFSVGCMMAYGVQESRDVLIWSGEFFFWCGIVAIGAWIVYREYFLKKIVDNNF